MQQTNASEPLGIYGDIIAQKDKFEQEWEQGLTIEDFRMQCKRKLKENVCSQLKSLYTLLFQIFLEELPTAVHYHLSPSAESHFSRYGENMQYTFFKRSKSPRTTWYIFFIKQDERILVKYITNNHKEGQYIR